MSISIFDNFVNIFKKPVKKEIIITIEIINAYLGFLSTSEEKISFRDYIISKYPHQYNQKSKIIVSNSIFGIMSLNAVNFSNISFNNCNFANAKFINCNFENCDFTGSVLSEGEFESSNFTASMFGGSKEGKFFGIKRGYNNTPNLKNCNFGRCNFENANLNHVDLTNSNISSCNFKNASLAGANLTKVNAEKSNFEGSLLRKADLTHASFENSKIKQTNLGGYQTIDGIFGKPLEFVTGVKSKHNPALAFINIKNAKIENTSFDHANMHQAEAQALKIKDSSLRHADLSNSNLSNAQIKTSDLDFANMHQAEAQALKIEDSSLRHADLSNSNLSNAQIKTTDLTDSSFKNATVNSNTDFTESRYEKPSNIILSIEYEALHNVATICAPILIPALKKVKPISLPDFSNCNIHDSKQSSIKNQLLKDINARHRLFNNIVSFPKTIINIPSAAKEKITSNVINLKSKAVLTGAKISTTARKTTNEISNIKAKLIDRASAGATKLKSLSSSGAALARTIISSRATSAQTRLSNIKTKVISDVSAKAKELKYGILSIKASIENSENGKIILDAASIATYLGSANAMGSMIISGAGSLSTKIKEGTTKLKSLSSSGATLARTIISTGATKANNGLSSAIDRAYSIGDFIGNTDIAKKIIETGSSILLKTQKASLYANSIIKSVKKITPSIEKIKKTYQNAKIFGKHAFDTGFTIYSYLSKVPSFVITCVKNLNKALDNKFTFGLFSTLAAIFSYCAIAKIMAFLPPVIAFTMTLPLMGIVTGTSILAGAFATNILSDKVGAKQQIVSDVKNHENDITKNYKNNWSEEILNHRASVKNVALSL